MAWSELPLHPNNRTLRQFAGLWIIFFGGMATWQAVAGERSTPAPVLAAVALSIGPIGLVWPRAIKPVFVTWMVAVFPIGWVVSLVLLGMLFYLIFTPIGWLFRLIGRDALSLKPKPEAATYWMPKPAIAPARYFHTY